MIYKNKLSRRKFIYIAFSAFLFSTFLISKKNQNNFYLTPELSKKVKSYNLKRLDTLKNNLNLAIKNDLEKNKTLWIENKLYTYAEIYYSF